MQTPTRLLARGRPRGQGSNRQTHLSRSAGVLDTARWKGDAGNRGRPVRVGGRGFNIAHGGGLGRVSDRVVVPSRPGNAGGGKDPDFWCAFDDGEERVIGDEP